VGPREGGRKQKKEKKQKNTLSQNTKREKVPPMEAL